MGITLTQRTAYGAKDQKKADHATKFIGRGSERSSTRQYAKDFGDLANCGIYDARDVVFVSAEGARGGRLKPDFAELERACRARVIFITDKPSDRDRAYNIGEREVAAYLMRMDYFEKAPGIWQHTFHFM